MAKIKYNLSVFAKTSLLFVVTLALGLASAYNHRSIAGSSGIGTVKPIEFGSSDIITMVVFFAIFSFVMLRFRRAGGLLLRVFFLIVIFSGSQVVFESFLPPASGLILSLLLVVTIIGGSTILFHNIAVMLGIAGLSSLLGLSITPITGVILLAVLSIYDIVAVYKTRHMVAMAENMVQSGAIFGFLIPVRWRDFSLASKDARPGQVGLPADRQVMILGSGDIGLPIVFASSLVSTSFLGAIFVGVCSVLGLFVTHLLFTNQKERRPMAALPPIAAATIVGYLVWTLL